LAGKRHAPERDAPVLARHEANPNVTHRDAGAVRRNHYELTLGDALRAPERACARRPDELRSALARDARRVEQMIVVAVTAQDRVDLGRDPPRDRRVVRLEPP